MRQMIKLMVMLLLLSITTTTNAAKVNATGVISSFEGTIEPFTNIDIAGAFDVTLAYGDSYSYKMEADEVFKTLNIFRVEEQTLYINLKGIKNNLKMKKGLPKIIIYVPSTVKFDEIDIEVSGASSFKTDDLKAKTLVLEVSGASSVSFKRMEIIDFELEISGAVGVELNGYADKCDIEMSGASSLRARDLDVKRCSVELSGVSSAKIGKVSDVLNVEISGVSKLYYSGNPVKTSFDTSGVSKIEMY